jgi:hypothetical protein
MMMNLGIGASTERHPGPRAHENGHIPEDNCPLDPPVSGYTLEAFLAVYFHEQSPFIVGFRGSLIGPA